MVWPRTVEGQPGKARGRGGADGLTGGSEEEQTECLTRNTEHEV